MFPTPAYNYRVTIDSETLSFSEVSGLSVDYEPVRYRHGMSFWLGGRIIPGMRQAITVTLSRGVLKDRSYLLDWINEVYGNPYTLNAKRTVKIELCDENSAPVVTWKLTKAMPTKFELGTLDASGNDVAVETLELAVGGLTISYD